MTCPACIRQLTELQVGNLTVDVCQGGCGGIWFDAFELQRVDEESEAAGEHLLDIQRDPQLRVDRSRKRECPRCPGIKLQRHFFSAKRQIEVDQCPNCAGYWLDAGELAQIRAEKAKLQELRKRPKLPFPLKPSVTSIGCKRKEEKSRNRGDFGFSLVELAQRSLQT